MAEKDCEDNFNLVDLSLLDTTYFLLQHIERYTGT